MKSVNKKKPIRNKKLKTLSSLKKELKKLKKHGKKIVFTNGCFDIIHAGHISYLKKAKQLGDILVLGLNSDLSIKKLKGRSRPIINQKDRIIVLSSIEYIDYIVLFNNLTPLNTIESIKPDILVKGGDWDIKDIVGYNIMKSYGGKTLSLPYIKGLSTTGIIKKIQKQKI